MFHANIEQRKVTLRHAGQTLIVELALYDDQKAYLANCKLLGNTNTANWYPRTLSLGSHRSAYALKSVSKRFDHLHQVCLLIYADEEYPARLDELIDWYWESIHPQLRSAFEGDPLKAELLALLRGETPS